MRFIFVFTIIILSLQLESFIGDMNVFPSYSGRGKYEPIVRSPIKQVYLAHEAGINASRTIGSFLRAVVDTILE